MQRALKIVTITAALPAQQRAYAPQVSEMEFSDLNEDICADSWLIQSSEISRRRFVRQTPRYKIYKADWFGDVLVYEPTSAADQLTRSPSPETRRPRERRQLSRSELSARLGELNLNLINSSCYSSSRGSPEGIEQADSAYSSISSTPQHTTKNIKSEFEFPGESPEAYSGFEQLVDENNNIAQLIEQAAQTGSPREGQRKRCRNQPLILNAGSYAMLSQTEELEGSNKANAEAGSSSDWLNEINELRLVAHESFMLFMGFSVASQLESSSQAVSLVMQINHPKAISLYNLLHGANLVGSPSSPLDR